ncbi:MAG: hypothetical protein FD146_2286 [Anaerolineaceae bacterium]|nr:MAG: hypothetical protein FD146_2286 [Anaerolineaceae bacterium]
MAKLGILFNIEELGGGLYGYEAYKNFFETMDTRKMPGVVLYDGDTRATLSGGQNTYCIAVESEDAKAMEAIKNKFLLASAKGLAPANERILEGAQIESEPLVLSAQVGPAGELVNCKTGWVLEAWNETRKKGSRVELLTKKDFQKRRRVYIRNEFIKSGIGLVIFLVFGALFSGKEFEGTAGACLGLFGYLMMLVGLELFVLRFIPLGSIHKEPFERSVLRSQNQPSWFHSVACPSCQHTNQVNVGYCEFTCQKCGGGNRHRSPLNINPPDTLTKGATCVSCNALNEIKDRPATFTCENCGQEVIVEKMPA